MWNPDVTFAGLLKTLGLMGVGAMAVGGWLWTGSAWVNATDLKLDTLAKNDIKIEQKIDNLEIKMDKKFDAINNKFDAIHGKFDFIASEMSKNLKFVIAEIRSLKK